MNRGQARKHAPPMVSDLGGLPSRNAFLVTAVAHTFQRLGVAAALLDESDDWHAINSHRNVTAFELAHGRGPERQVYNDGAVSRARREKKTLRAEHAGFSDLFVPIVNRGKVEALLIAGPFSTRVPRSAEVSERWRWLTGRYGHSADSQLAEYVAATLSTLTVEGALLDHFERWLEMLAERGDVRALSTEAARLSAKLEETRFAQRMWESTREMVDERTAGIWTSPQLGDDLLRLGARRLPEQVVVGLIAQGSEKDAVDALLRRHALRCACVELALGKSSVCGLVGDHGVMFLLTSTKSGPRLRHALTELAEGARSLARQYGLSLHVGISSDEGASPLPARYAQALDAAERALSRGLSMARAEPRPTPSITRLLELRRELSDIETMVAKFERYIEAVIVYSGHRLELARSHLAVGFEHAAQTLLAMGAIAERSYAETSQALGRTERDASTLAELCAAYRRAISDLVAMSERPVHAGQERSLRRALNFIGEHLGEPLSLTRVARVAGFVPKYFSEVFKKHERTTFENYLRLRRIERAKELLSSTDLSIDRICRISGFSSREYFHRVFKDLVRTTPIAYRNADPPSRFRPRAKTKRGARRV